MLPRADWFAVHPLLSCPAPAAAGATPAAPRRARNPQGAPPTTPYTSRRPSGAAAQGGGARSEKRGAPRRGAGDNRAKGRRRGDYPLTRATDRRTRPPGGAPRRGAERAAAGARQGGHDHQGWSPRARRRPADASTSRDRGTKRAQGAPQRAAAPFFAGAGRAPPCGDGARSGLRARPRGGVAHDAGDKPAQRAQSDGGATPARRIPFLPRSAAPRRTGREPGAPSGARGGSRRGSPRHDRRGAPARSGASAAAACHDHPTCAHRQRAHAQRSATGARS